MLKPPKSGNEDGINAVCQIGLQMLCVLGPIRKITALNSLTKYKRILFHVCCFLEIRHKDTKINRSNKTFSKKVVTKREMTC